MMGDRVARRGCGPTFWSGTAVVTAPRFFGAGHRSSESGPAAGLRYAAWVKAPSPAATRSWWIRRTMRLATDSRARFVPGEPWFGRSSRGRGSRLSRQRPRPHREPSAAPGSPVERVAAAAFAVRLRHGDVDASEAHRLAGAREASSVAQLGQDGDSQDWSDAPVAAQTARRGSAWPGP